MRCVCEARRPNVCRSRKTVTKQVRIKLASASNNDGNAYNNPVSSRWCVVRQREGVVVRTTATRVKRVTRRSGGVQVR